MLKNRVLLAFTAGFIFAASYGYAGSDRNRFLFGNGSGFSLAGYFAGPKTVKGINALYVEGANFASNNGDIYAVSNSGTVCVGTQTSSSATATKMCSDGAIINYKNGTAAVTISSNSGDGDGTINLNNNNGDATINFSGFQTMARSGSVGVTLIQGGSSASYAAIDFSDSNGPNTDIANFCASPSFCTSATAKARIGPAGEITAGSDITTGGRFVSRNAAGGITLGTAGTAYVNMPAGSANLNFNTLAVDFSGSSALNFTGHLVATDVAPAIASGFGTSPSISAPTSTAAFRITIGSSPGSTGTITLPTATTGWNCFASDLTTPGTNATKQTGGSTTTAVLTNYNTTTGIAANWTAADALIVNCVAY